MRGLHFQTGNYAQAKYVTILQGAVQDVVVDLREDSPTFKNVFHIELSAENHLQLFVPRGCAHGYITLNEKTLFHYKCDNYYHKASEAAIDMQDPNLSIEWLQDITLHIRSEKDTTLPTLEEYLRD